MAHLHGSLDAKAREAEDGPQSTADEKPLKLDYELDPLRVVGGCGGEGIGSILSLQDQSLPGYGEALGR